jgi:hypothetical protein
MCRSRGELTTKEPRPVEACGMPIVLKITEKTKRMRGAARTYS